MRCSALGSAQVAITALVSLASPFCAGVPSPGAAVLGLGLALSSTAIVLPLLGERELLTTPAGRDAFAVLLFQDLAFIPLVALVPLLASGHAVTGGLPWLEVAKGVARDRRHSRRRPVSSWARCSGPSAAPVRPSCSPPPRC